jgi:DnaJ-class molecular chaperone
MSEVRTILCETCGSEGRIYRQHVTNPYEECDHGECPDCRGTGKVEIEVCPVAMTEPSNGLCKHGYDVDRGVLCPVCDS